MGCRADVSGDEGRALPQVNTATGQTACWHEDKLLNGFCARPQQLRMQSGRRIVGHDANVYFIVLLSHFEFLFTQSRWTQEANKVPLLSLIFFFKLGQTSLIFQLINILRLSQQNYQGGGVRLGQRWQVTPHIHLPTFGDFYCVVQLPTSKTYFVILP